MEVRSLAIRYAQTLIEADTSASIEPIATEVLNAITTNPVLLELLDNPLLSSESKKDAFIKGIAGDLPPLFLAFFKLLVSKDRFSILPDILQEYLNLLAQNKGVRKGIIRSAQPLEEAQIQEIREKFRKDQKADLILEQVIDPSLIGGFQLQLGDTIYDWSLKNQLQSLRQRFTSLAG